MQCFVVRFEIERKKENSVRLVAQNSAQGPVGGIAELQYVVSELLRGSSDALHLVARGGSQYEYTEARADQSMHYTTVVDLLC